MVRKKDSYNQSYLLEINLDLLELPFVHFKLFTRAAQKLFSFRFTISAICYRALKLFSANLANFALRGACLCPSVSHLPPFVGHVPLISCGSPFSFVGHLALCGSTFLCLSKPLCAPSVASLVAGGEFSLQPSKSYPFEYTYGFCFLSRSFLFEATWAKEEASIGMVENAWQKLQVEGLNDFN